MNVGMHGWMDRWTVRQIKNETFNGWNEWMDIRTDQWTDGCIDGWMDGLTCSPLSMSCSLSTKLMFVHRCCW